MVNPPCPLRLANHTAELSCRCRELIDNRQGWPDDPIKAMRLPGGQDITMLIGRQHLLSRQPAWIGDAGSVRTIYL